MDLFRLLVLAVNALLGLVFAAGTMAAVSPAVAAFYVGGSNTDSAFRLSLAAGAVVAVLIAGAPTIRRGFGRGFLFLGSGLIALPVSAFLLSGRAFVEVADAASPVSVIGAGLAATLVTGVAAFFGLVLGTICLVAGVVLVLGGQREVVVVNANDINGRPEHQEVLPRVGGRHLAPFVRKEPPLK